MERRWTGSDKGWVKGLGHISGVDHRVINTENMRFKLRQGNKKVFQSGNIWGRVLDGTCENWGRGELTLAMELLPENCISKNSISNNFLMMNFLIKYIF